MKPHWVRKPFQVAAGHSIKTIIILQSIHTVGRHRSRPSNRSTHLSRPTDKMASEQVDPSALTTNRKQVFDTRVEYPYCMHQHNNTQYLIYSNMSHIIHIASN